MTGLLWYFLSKRVAGLQTSFSSSPKDGMRTFHQSSVVDIPNPGTEFFSIPDPGSKVKKILGWWWLWWSWMFLDVPRIPDPDLVFLPIPDPGIKKAPDPGSEWVEPQIYSFRNNIDAVLARARLHWCRVQISGQFAPLPCSGNPWTKHPRQVAWKTNRSYAPQ